MTPDQIRARCEQWMKKFLGIEWDLDYEEETALHEIESLYREALAKGLEMAAEIYESSGDEIGLSEVFREQATTLKEPPCEPSSS